MKIVESLRIINNTIRNNLENFRKFWIFNVNFNEIMRIFDVLSTLLILNLLLIRP